MKIILISGKAQNGKDTTANIIRDRLRSDGYSVLITHYAALLKFICQEYFDWDGVKDEDGRNTLQYVGTDVVRKQNPTFWVDFVATILTYFKDNWDYVIIPDCRFPDEITSMITQGFDVTHVRVTRSGFVSPLTDEQLKHSSETALDNTDADYYISNDETLDELDKKIAKWIKENLYEHKS